MSAHFHSDGPCGFENYPGFFGWLHARRRAHFATHAGACESSGVGMHAGGRCGPDAEDFGIGGSFGVRRPLRFLAFKLDLNEAQVTELATILNELKTERAQAAVDERRTVSAFADGLVGDSFDAEHVRALAAERVKSAERLKEAVVRALGRIHALLEPAQRAKLAYLIRTGALTI